MNDHAMTQLPLDLRRSLVEYARSVAASALGLTKEPSAPGCGDARAGSLVSLFREGVHCGFLGSLVDRPVAEAVAFAARKAATDDPRFAPLSCAGDVQVDVWLVGSMRSVQGPRDLCPDDGVMIVSGLNRGIYLPGLPGFGGRGVMASACIAADLHPDAWERDDVSSWAFVVDKLP